MSSKSKSKSKAKKPVPGKKKAAAKTAKKPSKVQAAEKEVKQEIKKEVKKAKVVEKEVREEVKKEAKKIKEAVERTPKVSQEAKKLGPAPSVTITSRHLDSTHERPGRGFSFGELESAGVPVSTAKREGLHLDIRRRSVLEGNVEALKAWYQAPAAAA